MAAVKLRPQASCPVLVDTSQVYVCLVFFFFLCNMSLKLSLANFAIMMFLYVYWLTLKRSSINLLVCNGIFIKFNNKVISMQCLCA